MAALQPRNDTKLERFCLENGRFSFLRLFFAQCRSASSFKRFVPEIAPFSRKTYQICHCEEGAFFARCRSASSFKHSFRKLFRFSAKPTRFVIARRARAPDAAIFDGTICHPGTNYGCAERNRTINKERGSGTMQQIPCFL